MRDGPFHRLWHGRCEEVVHLTRCRAGVVLAWETRPIYKQDRHADAHGVARAAIQNGWVVPAHGEQPSTATTLCAIVNTSEREALSEELRDEGGGEGNGGHEDGEGESEEFQESLCMCIIFLTGDRKFGSSVRSVRI